MNKAGRTGEAEKAYQRAIETWEQLLVDYPDVAINHHELARFLVQAPATGLCNMERATACATRATELAPDDASSWHTLGFVHYAAGRWEAARTALEQALKIRSEGSATGFLMAMAQFRLGDRSGAQQTYRQAIEWMEKNGQDDREFRDLRAEAAALLGEDLSVATTAQDEPTTQKMP
jgi:tetratricopeptide (TPR) repeat protein